MFNYEADQKLMTTKDPYNDEEEGDDEEQDGHDEHDDKSSVGRHSVVLRGPSGHSSFTPGY